MRLRSRSAPFPDPLAFPIRLLSPSACFLDPNARLNQSKHGRSTLELSGSRTQHLEIEHSGMSAQTVTRMVISGELRHVILTTFAPPTLVI